MQQQNTVPQHAPCAPPKRRPSNRRKRPNPRPGTEKPLPPAHEDYRTSPEPCSELRFWGQYVTDLSSEDDADDGVDSNERFWNGKEPSAMPPPIKKRKLDQSLGSHISSGAASIGYVVKQPQTLKKPTRMDAIREQLGLAMALYHFSAAKLADYANVPKPIFVKWLQGGIDQKPNVGVNSSNHNANKDSKNPSKNPSKTPIFKIRFKRSKTKGTNAASSSSSSSSSSSINTANNNKNSGQRGFYLTPLLADQIAEKMQRWLDKFIARGFLDKTYLEYVHHYKRYKRNNSSSSQKTHAVKSEAHSFDNVDMKWNKLSHDDKSYFDERNTNPSFDWNDDSSFYYKASQVMEGEPKQDLIPIQLEGLLRGKPWTDSFLWDPANTKEDLQQFVQVLCNDAREGANDRLCAELVESALAQVDRVKKIRKDYKNALASFGSKTHKRAGNYLQHLKKRKSVEPGFAGNLMNHVSDVCHGHVVIKIKVTHGKVRLVDEFLWNLNDVSNDCDGTIELFARNACADQGLPFKFATSIAISIRQQINAHKVKMTKSMTHGNGTHLNHVNDPLAHECLRFVGRKKKSALKNLELWQPKLLVHKPPNKMKTKLRDQL